MMPEQQQRILGYFIEEAKDHLNTIEQGLLRLQATIEDAETVNEVFRAAHSIKGGAAMLGIESVQQTAHRLEDYFKILKESPIQTDRTLESMFLQVFDGLQSLVEELQGPFGLTDDKSKEVMTDLEPVFGQLEAHLNTLAAHAPAAAPAATPAKPASTAAPTAAHTEESALKLVFRSDVPGHLREMLGLFKQTDTADSRAALQTVCATLQQIGEQFELSAWCELAQAAYRAVGNPEQTYRALAPVVIKDLKQAQEQVLNGRGDGITPSAAMQELLPPPSALPEPTEADLDALLDDALSTPDDTESDLADLFGAEAAAEDISEAADNDDMSWLDTADEPVTPEPVVDTTAADDLGDDFAAAFSGADLGGSGGESDQAPGFSPQGPEVEVGAAELNSLADLFEGEMAELDTPWQDGDAPEAPEGDSGSLDIDISSDFSDLLLSEEETPLGEEGMDSQQELADLFGDAVLDSAAETTDELSSAGTAVAATGADDDMADLFAIGDESPPADEGGDLDDLLAAATQSTTAPSPEDVDDFFGEGSGEAPSTPEEQAIADDLGDLFGTEATAASAAPDVPDPALTDLDLGLDLPPNGAEANGNVAAPPTDADHALGLGDDDFFSEAGSADLGLEESALETALGDDAADTPASDLELDLDLDSGGAAGNDALDLDLDLGDGGAGSPGDLDLDLDLDDGGADASAAPPEADDDLGLDLDFDTGNDEGTADLGMDLDLEASADDGLELDLSSPGETPDDLDLDLSGGADDPDALDLDLELALEAPDQETGPVPDEAEDLAAALDLDLDLDLGGEDTSSTAAPDAVDLGFDLEALDDGADALEGLEELDLDIGDASPTDAPDASDLGFDLEALEDGAGEEGADSLDAALDLDAIADSSAKARMSSDFDDLSLEDGAGEEGTDALDAALDLDTIADSDEDTDLSFDDLSLDASADELEAAAAPATEGPAATTDHPDVTLDLWGDEASQSPPLAATPATAGDVGEPRVIEDPWGGEETTPDADAALDALDELWDEGHPDAESPAGGETLASEADALFDDLGEMEMETAPAPSADGVTDDLDDLFSTDPGAIDASAVPPEEAASTIGTDGDVGDLEDLFGASDAATGAEELDDLFGTEAAAPEPEPETMASDLDLGADATAAASDDDMGDLEALLEDTDAPAASPVETADADFDGLESMLAEDSAPAEESGFDDLEAMLDDDSAGADDDGALDDLDALLDDDAKDIAADDTAGDDDFGDLEKLLGEADQLGGSSPTMRTGGGGSRASRRVGAMVDQTMRVSVKHLDTLSNLVGELVVNRNSLEQDQERLRQFLDNLLFQVQQLNDVGQRMRDLYERSLLESSLISSRHAFHAGVSTGGNGGGGSRAAQGNGGEHATGATFDALEMDRFTGFHTLSQEMIELIVRVRESASDIGYTVESSDQITRQFRQVTTQLQEGLNKARMVPFAQTADRLPRAVRDISLKCGKEARLVVEGRDTLIDKMILERLYDPMTHLVNNAITHGIETPDERVAAGKSREGTITVRAFYQGNQTVIYIADDGAGINTNVVKQKAIKKGLITQAEARSMSELETHELLFRPGFSTRDKADDFAGRGVGMDVVRTALSEIRGAITIDSGMGKGTGFTIRLPLTLSISKALSCLNNQARIAFPMDGVEDMFDVPQERVQRDDEGRASIMWRDTQLNFQPLSELLQFNRTLGRGRVYGGSQDDDMVSIVVLRNANTYIGLQVDRVLGEQEIVIKQLEGPVPKPVGIAGATVLGDGRVMPIADVLELIDLAQGRVRREASTSLWAQESPPLPDETEPVKAEPTVLIVDDSITVRELLSMSFNKVGYRVEQARDGQEAWEKLRSGLPCDLVFCDIEMPRMDGLELLSRMQKDGALKHVPIAMLTSRGADRHRQMAMDLGANGYFTKPYLEEALLDAAQRMLNGEVLLTASKED
jgi:chemotaxis protein histidine kinase CheA/ActR/RegA family two-component response regulator